MFFVRPCVNRNTINGKIEEEEEYEPEGGRAGSFKGLSDHSDVETERKHAVVVNGKYSTACSFT